MNNMDLKYNLIIATDSQNGFGCKGSLPWNIPKELKYFKQKRLRLTLGFQKIFISKNKGLFQFYLVLTILNILLVSATALLSFQLF